MDPRARVSNPALQASGKQIDVTEKEKAFKILRWNKIVISILEMETGRIFLDWLLRDVCQIDGEMTDPTSSKIYSNLGARKVGLELKKMLRKECLRVGREDLFILLLKQMELDVQFKER